jgi:hypothetical protein
LAQDPINFEAVYQDALISARQGRRSQGGSLQLEFLEHFVSAQCTGPLSACRRPICSLPITPAKQTRGTPSKARKNRLSDAIKLDPEARAGGAAVCRTQDSQRQRRGNRTPCAKLIKERPQTAHAYYLLAASHMAQGQTTEAASTYQQMVALLSKGSTAAISPWAMSCSHKVGKPKPERHSSNQSWFLPITCPATERLLDLDIS